MKKIAFKNTFFATIMAALITACGTEHDLLKDVQVASGARVKFFHAAPDAPGVALFVNDKKFSGVLTVAPATPGVVTYGNVFPGTDYALVEAGSAKARLVVPASGATAETTVFSGTVPVEADKYYSVFATGIAPTYGAALVQDNIPAFNDRQLFFRLVNMVPNSTAAAVTVAGATIAEKVEFGKASSFTPYNLAADFKGGSVAVSGFSIKTDGPGGVTTTSTLNLTGLTAGRAVTIVVRGVLPTTPTGTTKYPITISNYNNR
ncbi:DUF4397 domain-containing protein [Runella sp.]|uniref:DUF4397 domain-containing protein n=1 Tax=Runella sp. TaxID=1960881 RepID=UPI00301859C4